MIDIWIVFGGIVFALAVLFVDDMPDKFVWPFVVACGPLAWLSTLMAWGYAEYRRRQGY